MSTRVAFSLLMVTIIMGVAAYCWLLITGRRAVFDNLEVLFSDFYNEYLAGPFAMRVSSNVI